MGSAETFAAVVIYHKEELGWENTYHPAGYLDLTLASVLTAQQACLSTN